MAMISFQSEFIRGCWAIAAREPEEENKYRKIQSVFRQGVYSASYWDLSH